MAGQGSSPTPLRPEQQAWFVWPVGLTGGLCWRMCQGSFVVVLGGVGDDDDDDEAKRLRRRLLW